MNHCRDCEYYRPKVVDISRCSMFDPYEVGEARRYSNLCGIEGRFFVKKVVVPPLGIFVKFYRWLFGR
jgi:hypothetical protein